jgi:hypothetical protein
MSPVIYEWILLTKTLPPTKTEVSVQSFRDLVSDFSRCSNDNYMHFNSENYNFWPTNYQYGGIRKLALDNPMKEILKFTSALYNNP